MDSIDKFLSTNSKYQRLSKPLTAARVCEAARVVAHDRFRVVSFREGLLTAGTENSSAAANLQMESTQIIANINKALREELVEKIRFKII